MDKRKVIVVAIAYFGMWAAIVSGVIYGVIQLGGPWWSALIAAFLLFQFGNGSVAYMARSRRDRLEGREPPTYIRYIFFPSGIPKPADLAKDEAPKYLQVLVGIVAVLGGTFFLACAVGLTWDAEFSRMENLIFPVLIILLVAGIGVAFIFTGLRLIVSKGSASQ